MSIRGGSHSLEITLNGSYLLPQILIWKLAPQILESSLLCLNEGDTSDVNSLENRNLGDKEYMAVQLGRLKEHEGSIFRIAWSSDGSKFMSVSDDRRLVNFCTTACNMNLFFLFQTIAFYNIVGLLSFSPLLLQCSHVDFEFQAREFCQSDCQS